MFRIVICCVLVSLILSTTQADEQTPKTRQDLTQKAGQKAGQKAVADAAPASTVLPATTVLYAQWTDVKGLLATVFDHPLRTQIESLPAHQQATASEPYEKFLVGQRMFENLMQMSWREAIETFAEKGIALAFDGSSQAVAVIVTGKDDQSMQLFREKLLTLVSMAKSGKLVKQVQYRGVQANRIDDIRIAVVGNRLLLTNDSQLGKSVLDRMLGDDVPTLSDNDHFRQALAMKQADATAWAFANVETIRDAGVAKHVFDDQINQPVAELLLGGIQSNLQHAPFVCANLIVRTEQLKLQIRSPHQSDWVDEARAYYFGTKGDGRGLAIAAVPETLFTFSTHRDFAEMWLRAGDLFDVRVNDEFAKADATLTTLFAGRDFGEDILGSFEPEVAFVAVRNHFRDDQPRPTIKLPAFGVVMTMKRPQTMTRELRRTFQSMVGFFNVIGAMNGQRQLELGSDAINDHAQLFSSAYVPEEDDRESSDAPIAFNFSPTIGFADDRFVLASTTELARQLTVAKAPQPNRIAANTAARVHADVLQHVLADNREQLIAQNMLEDGNSHDEAQAAIELLLEVVGYLRDASVRLQQTQGQLQLDFSIGIGQSS